MASLLVLTTDLPFFPGKNGHDFFNLRYTAQRHAVGVVAPVHPHYPAAGVANLEAFLTGAYFWPRTAAPVALPPLRDPPGPLAGWVRRLPRGVRQWLLRRSLRLSRQPAGAYSQLTTLANNAPQLLQAFAERRWQVVGLLQSSTEPWLDYLPAQPAKFVYFHDVRADYLRDRAPPREARAVAEQERRVCQSVEVVGFVSELDEQRARRLLQPAAATGVAPIPVDTDYYTPAPPGWVKDQRPVVLFTGHLGHPPNVDAALYFLEQIWPYVRRELPDAVWQVVGLHPDPRLPPACAAAAGVELHPNVPDIRPFFWNATVYVVPMRYGGGVRQKIFEAWAMELPVVCTTMAAEGIKAVTGENCWLADDPAGFAARVVEQLRSPQRAIVAPAREVVERHHSIPAAASRFEELAHRAIQIKRQRPFKLLFDLRWMQIGKAGGAEQMSHELVAEVARLDHRNAYRVLCPRSTYQEWNFPRGFQCAGIFTDSHDARCESYQAGVANQLAESVGRAPLRTPAMRALRWYRRLDFDVVHSTIGYSCPDVRSFPNLLTVHDLQHVHYPEFFTPAAWQERETLYRESVAAAAHIHCISEFTRQDLHQQYGVPLAKMTTIWNILARTAWLTVAEPRRRAVLGQLGVSGPFLFFPAHSWPHKNHRRLVEAFALALPELPADLQLVLSGRPFEADHPARVWLREHPELRGRVLHVGYRSSLEMRALYHGARALVFPSLFEGFGMPVAEAIIADCPVVCARTTSLPEIAGDAALYFDPLDPADIARALVRIATDERQRAELSAAGQRRKPRFSARRSAVHALSVYRQVFEAGYVT